MVCHTGNNSAVSSASKITTPGADDRANQTAFHALKRRAEEEGEPAPDRRAVLAWVSQEITRIADHPVGPRLTEAKRADLVRRLSVVRDNVSSGRSIPDGPTFYAWRNLRAHTADVVASRASETDDMVDPPSTPPPAPGQQATNCPDCGRWAGESHDCAAAAATTANVASPPDLTDEAPDQPGPAGSDTGPGATGAGRSRKPGTGSRQGASGQAKPDGPASKEAQAAATEDLAAAYVAHQRSIADPRANHRAAQRRYEQAVRRFDTVTAGANQVKALQTAADGARVTEDDVATAAGRAREATARARRDDATEQDSAVARDLAEAHLQVCAAYDTTPVGRHHLRAEMLSARDAGNHARIQDLERRQYRADRFASEARARAATDPAVAERARLRDRYEAATRSLADAQARARARPSRESAIAVKTARDAAGQAREQFYRSVPTPKPGPDLGRPEGWSGEPPAGVTRREWWGATEWRARVADGEQVRGGELSPERARARMDTRHAARQEILDREGGGADPFAPPSATPVNGHPVGVKKEGNRVQVSA